MTDAPSNTAGQTKRVADVSEPNPLAEAEGAVVLANTDVLSSDVSPTIDGSHVVVRVAVNTSAVLSVDEDVGATGSDDRTQQFNNGTTIGGNTINEFPFAARSSNNYNFQLDRDVTVLVMEVIEYPHGSPA